MNSPIAGTGSNSLAPPAVTYACKPGCEPSHSGTSFQSSPGLCLGVDAASQVLPGSGLAAPLVSIRAVPVSTRGTLAGAFGLRSFS
jgi:hypothetical protein